MPELPEVETVKRTLNQLIVGKHIERVTVNLPRIIQRPDDIQQFAFMLEQHTIQGVERRGKFLRILLDGLVLVSHLRMEGRYGVYRAEEPVEKHTHVIFHFTDGTELRYKDVRQFGTMHLFATGRSFSILLSPSWALSRWTRPLPLTSSKPSSARRKPKSRRCC